MKLDRRTDFHLFKSHPNFYLLLLDVNRYCAQQLPLVQIPVFVLDYCAHNKCMFTDTYKFSVPFK